jgi:aspartate/methionine/tyrosine aminotransferase
MMHAASSRIAAVQPPVIPIVGRWIRETPGTVSLGQGVVSWGPPQEALDALRTFGRAAEAHRYGAVEGESALVDAIVEKLEVENGIRVAPDARLVVTAGGNMAFMNAVLAVADTGDEVILQAPFYFNHEMAVAMAGAVPVAVPTDAHYGLDPDAVARAITPRTRAIVTISPNNPTGAVYALDALAKVNELCAERGLFHIHDEVYEYFTYDATRHVSPGARDGAGAHTISLFSLSKAYGFASWRIGYMVVPLQLWDAVNKIQDTILICPPLVSQHAALAALEVGARYCRERIPALDATRRKALARLAAASDVCEVPAAAGAFYFLLRLRRRVDPVVLAERLVREHGVATIPGTAFGVTADPTLRVSYGALQPESVAEGIDRLVNGLVALLG